MNSILRDIFVILAICHIGVNASNCTTVLEGSSDTGFSINMNSICDCMGFGTPIAVVDSINDTIPIDQLGLIFFNGSVRLGHPDKICLKAGFSKTLKKPPRLLTRLPDIPTKSNETEPTSTTTHKPSDKTMETNSSTEATTISTTTTNTTQSSPVTDPMRATTTDKSTTNSSTEATTISTTTAITTLSPPVPDPMRATTTDKSTTNSSTEATTISTTTAITTLSPLVPDQMQATTTDKSTTNSSTEATTVSITTANTTLSPPVTDPMRTTTTNRAPETSELKTNKSSINGALIIMLSSLIAGCLIAIATKVIYNKYKAQDYQLPPDQQELESPNGNAGDTNTVLINQ